MLTFHNTILTYLFAYKLLANTKQHQQREEEKKEKKKRHEFECNEHAETSNTHKR